MPASRLCGSRRCCMPISRCIPTMPAWVLPAAASWWSTHRMERMTSYSRPTRSSTAPWPRREPVTSKSHASLPSSWQNEFRHLKESTMDTDALRDQLMKLHEELGAARRIDPRSQQLLGEIMEDIKRLMDQDL